ncbi:MAG TPA: isoamylase [Povalibacter sp.]
MHTDASVRATTAVAANPQRYITVAGTHFPPGASADAHGCNFSIFSRAAVAAQLLLYERGDSDEPFQVITLTPDRHRTFLFWHVYVKDPPPGTHYTWCVAGSGQSLDVAHELLDPWARAVSDARWDRQANIAGRSRGRSLRAIVATADDTPPAAPCPSRDPTDLVIYEMHVGGFTRHASSGVRHPGTFAGLIDKIPYLRELGITHVELLPVMAFDEQDVPPGVAALGLSNYWGYSSYGFYAPHPHYCVEPARGPQEFRDCVRALHDAGIGVLLDVVFNHTAEGGAGGPVINFKALANDIFYHHEPHDASRYRDYTGCGNTINCNHPLVTNFIRHCLEYWVEHCGVDGFRFDLASVFTRDGNGVPLSDPPLTWSIELSHSLMKRPIIAEAWDAMGLYQVGGFPGMRWAEWNGRYRDTLRRFVRGDAGLVGEVATRLAGSHDMYAGRTPLHSVNFVTCHDGFTLHDLVSYNEKHNEANGEGNRDGSNDNMSWNCGAEGESSDAAVIALRRRQAKNFLAILFLSQGVPMLLAGDEVLRSQRGNNNAYCQDDELGWFDWRQVESNQHMLRFTRELIALRRRHPGLRRRGFLSGHAAPGAALPDICWHGERLNEPPWHDREARLLAFTLAGTAPQETPLHVILNMSPDERTVKVPRLNDSVWRCALDTSRSSPRDITPPEGQKICDGDLYVAQSRSVVVLEGQIRVG